MKTEQIVILVVAFFLGMLLLNMVKNVCGCNIKEGFRSYENTSQVASPDAKNCGTYISGELCSAGAGERGIPDRQFDCSPGNDLLNFGTKCSQSMDISGLHEESNEDNFDNLNPFDDRCTNFSNLNDWKTAVCGAPPGPTCTSYPEITDGYTITDGVLDSDCAPGFTGNASSTCEEEPEWTLDGCNPGCSDVAAESCPNPFYTVDGSQICGDGVEPDTCNEDTCCTAFDSTKWVEDPTLEINSLDQFNHAAFSDQVQGQGAYRSCPSNPVGPGCAYPFVYTTGNGCILADPNLTAADLITESSRDEFNLCKPADSAATQLICPTPTR